MNNKLITDVGENYEYIKTIVQNSIELKKIEFAEKSSVVISNIVLALILSVMGIFAICFLLVLSTLGIVALTGSVPISLMIMIVAIGLVAIITYLLRHKLIVEPVTKMIVSSAA